MVVCRRVGEAYEETGGLRWGRSFMWAMNASWPFAKLRASHDRICIEMSFLGLMRKQFDFTRSDIRKLRRRSGVMSVGLLVEHSRAEYPQFILFWSLRFPTLKARLERLGYEVLG